MKSKFLVLFLSITTSLAVVASDDPVAACTGPDRWATNIAHQVLQEQHIITKQIPELDLSIERITSEKIDADLYRQVHFMTFTEDGDSHSVITVNDVSSEECSMSGVTVYLVDKRIDGNG
jgi:hypothetical protein